MPFFHRVAYSTSFPVYTKALALLMVLLWGLLTSGIVSASEQQASPVEVQPNEAVELVELSHNKLQTFMESEHWQSVKNLTGIAKAIVILPSGGQGGLLLGAQWGKGIMLVRKQHSWSDPIFVKLGSLQLGLLAGGQSVNTIGVILSDQVLNQVLEGTYKFGGSADLTIGPGVSGKAAGSLNGIELLMVSENKGVYLGGSIEGVHLYVDDKRNKLAYGDEVQLNSIVDFSKRDQLPAAKPIQEQLEQVAYKAVFGE